MGARDVLSAHSGSTNVIINARRIPVDEIIYRKDCTKSAWTLMLPHEKKSSALMKYLVQNFCTRYFINASIQRQIIIFEHLDLSKPDDLMWPFCRDMLYSESVPDSKQAYKTFWDVSNT